MEIARYTFEQSELGAISKPKRRALGGITLTLLRRLGSPEHLSFTEDAVPEIAAILSPAGLPEEAGDILPAFDARQIDGRHIVSARLPGLYKRRFPLAVDLTYLLNEPRHDATHQNLLAITDVHKATIDCWPDRYGTMDFPDTDELTGDFAVDVAVKALRRLRKENLPDSVVWQMAHDNLE